MGRQYGAWFAFGCRFGNAKHSRVLYFSARISSENKQYKPLMYSVIPDDAGGNLSRRGKKVEFGVVTVLRVWKLIEISYSSSKGYYRLSQIDGLSFPPPLPLLPSLSLSTPHPLPFLLPPPSSSLSLSLSLWGNGTSYLDSGVELDRRS